jgi:hypothetical protein
MIVAISLQIQPDKLVINAKRGTVFEWYAQSPKLVSSFSANNEAVSLSFSPGL